jgi:hypothetical protein
MDIPYPHIPKSFLARCGNISFRNLPRGARKIGHEEMGIKGKETVRDVRMN